jgi:hypothetical protein
VIENAFKILIQSFEGKREIARKYVGKEQRVCKGVEWMPVAQD